MKIAIIPARGGSKRIPKKNIKEFSGMPIIAWSIEAAKMCKMFDRIIVSTDDYEIAAIAKQLGADVNYAWPSAQIAVMGAKGATEILHRADLGDDDKIAQHTADYEERFANPFVAAQRGFVDEVINPRSTRRRIARSFELLKNKKVHQPFKKHDNIPL